MPENNKILFKKKVLQASNIFKKMEINLLLPKNVKTLSLGFEMFQTFEQQMRMQ